MIELWNFITGEQQRSAIAIMSSHQRASYFKGGVIAGASAGVYRGDESVGRADFFLDNSSG